MAQLGLRYGVVTVVDHDPSWLLVGSEYAAEVAALLDGLAAGVEHIGSTSVPGLAAKPVIDLAVRQAPGVPFASVRDVLTEAGYIYRGDAGPDGGQVFVAESEAWVRVVHLHVVAADDPQWSRYLAVRDRLRADPAAVARYSALKRELAVRYAADRRGYTSAKTEFMRDLLA
ncbi:MAG: GrpB family protein [Hamadaea sp.]|uniref:GrpB family protein n=1 Tax=Hamadaea sp. TaxID=2024425 RepID=UPI0017C1A2ED|nr:GrpB family protein [Hamadaea sp.]NUT22765.1 GrpB family protein [Hamadaea sp.]